MNNPLRALIQAKYEMKILRSMSSREASETVLEIGCGNGSGTKIIKEYFSPAKIMAIDLDESMIKLAQSRKPDNTIEFKVMDASRLNFPDSYFDVVFDFGIIHHIPNWQDCIKEIKRVLKPGGEFICEDLSIDSFSKGIGKLWRKILDHPYAEMYSAHQFTEFLTGIGFDIEHYLEANPLRMLRHFSLNAIRK